MSIQSQADIKAQNAFAGRMAGMALMHLFVFGLWVGVSILFTPLPSEGAEAVYAIRGLLIGIGGITTAIVAGFTARRLCAWGT